jgi:hypothetical protein
MDWIWSEQPSSDYGGPVYIMGVRCLVYLQQSLRTRMHGGVAGVSGQPLPLCRSTAYIE